MRLVFTEPFRNELRREVLFIKGENPKAAGMVRDRIRHSIKRLKRFPESGRSWRSPGTWELVIPGLSYLVIYKIRDDTVFVLTLFHTSRELSDGH